MNKIPVTIWALLIMPIPSQAEETNVLSENNFSANVGFTSNYLFRGLTVSDDEPAISGGFEWAYSGFYLGIWGTSIDRVETESMEIDYYGGYYGDLKGFSYTLEAWYYDYPGEASAGEPEDIGELGYWEYGGSLAYAFDFYLSPSLGVKLLHSPDYYAETGEATAVEGLLGLSLPADFGLNLTYGNQEFDENLNGIDDYRYYDINLSKSVVGFDFTAGFTDTDDDGEIYLEQPTGDWYFSIGKVF